MPADLAHDRRQVAWQPQRKPVPRVVIERDLAAAHLGRLDAYALRTQRAITIPLIKSMLENE